MKYQLKHLCSCGEVVEAKGDTVLLTVGCPNCGTYCIFTHQIINPHKKEEVLKEEIEHKVQALDKPRPAKRRTNV